MLTAIQSLRQGVLIALTLLIGNHAWAADPHTATNLPVTSPVTFPVTFPFTFVDAGRLSGGAGGPARFVSVDRTVILEPGSISVARRGAGRHDRIRIRFAGAEAECRIEGSEPVAAPLHLFLGKDPANWNTLSQYQRVRMRGVYPGIDVEVYARQGSLEYDFVLAPGADPDRIRLRFEGGGKVRHTANGDLEIRGRHGRLLQHRPAVYQERSGQRRAVTGEYAVTRQGEARFRIGARDANAPLVIDPVIAYSSTFASGANPIQSMVTDKSGFVYIAGASDLDVTAKGYGTGGAMFLARFDPTRSGAASLLYTAVFSGGSISALAVDDSGNAYVAGRSSGDFVPIVKGYQAHPAGLRDAFAARFNTLATGTASLVYSTYLGGSASDDVSALLVDAAGGIALGGSTASADFPVKNGFQTKLAGATDAWVAKLNSNASGAASLLYAGYLGGAAGSSTVTAAALDRSGRMVLLGGTNSRSLTLKTPFQADPAPGFVAKVDFTLSGAASLVFSTYFGSNAQILGMALDASDSIYLCGEAVSGGIPTQGAFQTGGAGATGHGFVARLNAAASLLTYATFLGGAAWEQVQRLAVDPAGYIYAAGATTSRDFPIRGGFQTFLAGQYDSFVAKLDPDVAGDGSLVYSSYLGGSGRDDVLSFFADAAGRVVVAGTTSSPDFPQSNGFQATFGGNYDAFVARIDPGKMDLDSLVYSSTFGGTGFDGATAAAALSGGRIAIAGSTASVDFPAWNAFQPALASAQGGFVTVITESAPGCGYFFRSGSAAFAAAGGAGTADMTASNGCAWSAVASDPWITLASGASGTGRVLIGYSVAQNFQTQGRGGAIYAAGQTFSIFQNGIGCQFSLSATTAQFSSTAGTRSIGLTASGGDCVWNALSNAPWITVNTTAGTGSGQVSYSVADNAGPIRSGTLRIAGINFTVTQSGAPVVSSAVVNAASFGTSVSASSWIAITGANLAQSTRSWAGADFAGNRLPTSLDGVTVKVGGLPAPISYISPTQVNALIPDTATGTVDVVLANQDGAATYTVKLDAVSPAMFVFDPGGRRYAAAVNPDGTYAGAAGLFGNAAVSRPVRPGDRVTLFGTGFGAGKPAVPVDVVFQGASPLVNPVTIRVGSAVAAVEFAGITGVGLYQFNIVVPDVPDGDQAIVAQIGGVASQTGVFLTVQR